jgi:hypothetical protein
VGLFAKHGTFTSQLLLTELLQIFHCSYSYFIILLGTSDAALLHYTSSTSGTVVACLAEIHPIVVGLNRSVQNSSLYHTSALALARFKKQANNLETGPMPIESGCMHG